MKAKKTIWTKLLSNLAQIRFFCFCLKHYSAQKQPFLLTELVIATVIFWEWVIGPLRYTRALYPKLLLTNLAFAVQDIEFYHCLQFKSIFDYSISFDNLMLKTESFSFPVVSRPKPNHTAWGLPIMASSAVKLRGKILWKSTFHAKYSRISWNYDAVDESHTF